MTSHWKAFCTKGKSILSVGKKGITEGGGNDKLHFLPPALETVGWEARVQPPFE